jgi:hypothetical protein
MWFSDPARPSDTILAKSRSRITFFCRRGKNHIKIMRRRVQNSAIGLQLEFFFNCMHTGTFQIVNE